MFEELATPDKKVNLHIPELIDWLAQVQPRAESLALEPDPEFPFILMAGRHYQYTANSLLRHPGFKKGKNGELAVHPDDAVKLGLAQGDDIRITTSAGSVVGPVELDPETRPGFAVAPHGFGLQYQGEEIGVNINLLTSARHRDPAAGHRSGLGPSTGGLRHARGQLVALKVYDLRGHLVEESSLARWARARTGCPCSRAGCRPRACTCTVCAWSTR